MKVHITADMEGIATLCHDVQVEAKGLDYPRMRQIMTGEVQAAIEGAKDAGADEIVVCDAHDTGRNLIVEDMDDDVVVIQGSAYELGMMAGMDGSFDAGFQIGYHSMAQTHKGTLGHTYTFDIAALRLNGTLIGESGLSAAIAGHFGVPIVLVSGDLHAVNQLKGVVKNAVGVPTKEGVGLYGSRSLTPQKARQVIRAGAKKALEARDEIRPYVVRRPVRMEVELARPLMAQFASDIPLVKREGVRTVSYKGKDVLDVFRAFETILRVAVRAKEEGPL